MDRFRGAAACAHRQNHRGAAGNDVASGEDSFTRGALRFFAGLNVAALVRAQAGRGALHDRIRAGTDSDHGHL